MDKITFIFFSFFLFRLWISIWFTLIATTFFQIWFQDDSSIMTSYEDRTSRFLPPAPRVPRIQGLVSGDTGFMDDNEDSFQELSSSSQQRFNILCSGDRDGIICFSIFGIFPIGKIVSYRILWVNSFESIYTYEPYLFSSRDTLMSCPFIWLLFPCDCSTKPLEYLKAFSFVLLLFLLPSFMFMESHKPLQPFKQSCNQKKCWWSDYFSHDHISLLMDFQLDMYGFESMFDDLLFFFFFLPMNGWCYLFAFISTTKHFRTFECARTYMHVGFPHHTLIKKQSANFWMLPFSRYVHPSSGWPQI